MPDFKISQLPPATLPLTRQEVVPLVQGGVTKQATLVNLSSRIQRSVTASPIIVASNDEIININITSGAPTCALPAAATRNGVPLTFKDVGSQAQAHPITLTPNGVETIDGLPAWVLNINRQSVTLVPYNDGVNSGWMVL